MKFLLNKTSLPWWSTNQAEPSTFSKMELSNSSVPDILAAVFRAGIFFVLGTVLLMAAALRLAGLFTFLDADAFFINRNASILWMFLMGQYKFIQISRNSRLIRLALARHLLQRSWGRCRANAGGYR